MPLIPKIQRQRQKDLYEFKASLYYLASSRTGRNYIKTVLGKDKGAEALYRKILF